MNTKKILAILVVLTMIFSVLVGCQKETKTDNNTQSNTATKTNSSNLTNNSTSKTTDSSLKGKLTVEGSTSVTAVMELLKEDFESKNPGVTIEITANGSGAGVEAASNGSTDIGMASRKIKASEDQSLTINAICYDAIAIAVHPSNNVSGLTEEQIQKIFKGEITNWNEVGGSDSEIVVISREDGSGTRDAFEELMDLEDAVEATLIANSNGNVKTQLSSKESSIGYMSLGYVDDSVKALRVDGVVPTASNVLNGSYSVKRPFNLLTKGDVGEIAQTFLDYAFSAEGQKIVSEKWVPVK